MQLSSSTMVLTLVGVLALTVPLSGASLGVIHSHKVFAPGQIGLSRAAAVKLKALRAGKAHLDPAWVQAVIDQPNDFGVHSIHQIELFPDVSITYVVTDSDLLAPGRLVIFGKVAGQPQSNVVLAFNNGCLNGSILVPGAASYQIASGPGGLHTILQLDPSQRPDCGVH
jgi:hypothetical protein